MGPLRAGAAAEDISPSGPTALFGYPHVERISTGIHDPLLASALYLDNGWQAAVLMALDLLMLEPPTARSIRRAVAERLGVPEEAVFISCTHTHSGPVTSRLLAWQDDPTVPSPDGRYLQWIADRAVAAAARAAQSASPAEMAWSTADARGVGGNRLEPAGVTDPEAGILAVRAAGGGPLIAVAVIYGMHPTVLHEDSTLVSSDFPHYTRLELREQFGSSLTVLYHTAPCGNQSPRFFVSGQTFDEAERLGRKLGSAVAASLRGPSPPAPLPRRARGAALEPRRNAASGEFSGTCPLRGVLRSVELPRRSLPSVADCERLLDRRRAEYQRLRSEQVEPARVRTAECAVFGAEGTAALARLQDRGELEKALQAYRPIEIQAVRIGEAALIGLPGECFTEYALEIKRRWPGRAFVVSLVNGDLQGYIVTEEAAAQGGYEATTALFDPTAGRVLVDQALELSRVIQER